MVDDDEVVSKLRELMRGACGVWDKLHSRMRTDMTFTGAGSHWGETDVKLRGEHRARQQFPLLDKYVERIVGNYNAHPYSIQVCPLMGAAESLSVPLQNMVRAIETKSETRYAYRQALRNAAATGYGWLSVTTDYGDDDATKGFVEVKIETIEDPCSVVIDPASRFVDGRDAHWAVVREYLNKEAAKTLFGKQIVNDYARSRTGIFSEQRSDDMLVEVLTFYEMEADEKGEKKCCKYRVIGDQVAHENGQEPRELPLKRLPIIPVYGLPVIEEGAIRYISVIHRAIDAQRDVNYTVSVGAERLALSPTAKILAATEALAGNEHVFADANRSNKSVLPYRAYDDAGRQLPVPTKLDPAINTTDIAQSFNLYTQAISETIGFPLDGIGGSTTKILTAEETLTKARAAETVLSTIYENLAASVRAVGRLTVELIVSQYVGERPFLMQTPDGAIQKQVVNFDQIPFDLSQLNIEIEAGPLLATQRKELIHTLLALQQVSPPQYHPLLFAKIVESLDGVDPQFRQQVAQITMAGMQDEQQTKQQLQFLQTQNKQLEQQLNIAQQALLEVKTRTQDAAITAESRVMQAKIAADATIQKEVLQQNAENDRQQIDLAQEREKDMNETWEAAQKRNLEKQKLLQDAVIALNRNKEAAQNAPRATPDEWNL